uniref:Myb-like domain-containing protein n=1 Tax=Brassica oleracea var. oleracea TaxID=109376 RepID=A0A0D2ZXL7_BRAOL
GNEQRSVAFWKRVAAYFEASPKVGGCEKREPSHCKQRWQKINDLVSKFAGAYEAATREKRSGQNENDVLKLAQEIFFTNHNKKFTLEHAWKELRNDQKWCALYTAKKCTAAIRVLAYGTAADTVDEYLRLGESTTRKCVEYFVEGIINLFGDEYLRRPTPADLQRLLDIGEYRGFPGMIGSIDCMHWEWKSYPTAWKGQYCRGSRKPTIVLEAVASYDLWIWHAFFGPP